MQLAKQSSSQPLLCSYSSDVAPAKAAYHHVDKHSSHSAGGSVRRVGYDLEAFLLQRSFFKSTDAGGHGRLAALVSTPKAMSGDSGGKKTQDLSAAFLEHGHLLKEQGVSGICVSHYCFDRAYYSSLTRLACQRHRLWQASQVGGEGEKKIFELTGSIHDAQNALQPKD